MRRVRRAVGAAAAVGCLLGAGVLSGCGSSGSSGSAELVRIGSAGTIDSLSPFLLTLLGAAELETIQYPFLVQYDSTTAIKPDFAQSWTFSADKKALTLKVATGGKWSDGQPLTADDVAWTYNTIVKDAAGGTAALAPYIPDVTGAKANGADEVTIEFKAPSPHALGEIVNIPILPRHVWEKYAANGGKGLTTFNNPAPVVGGGPFYVAKYSKGQSVLLKRNPGYYGPKPHVNAIGFSLYSNSDAMTKALQAGEVDAVENVPPPSLKAVRSSGANVQTPDSIIAMWLNINSTPNNPDKELADPVVRQALDAAINRSQIVSTAYFGAATPGSSVIPSALPPYHKDVAVESYDPATANALLDQAGYKKGSDGIRVANGHPMSYSMVVIASPGSGIDSAANILREDFKQVGIKLKVTSLDPTAAIAGIFGPKKDYKSEFQFSLGRIASSFDPGSFLSYFSCAGKGSSNYSGYCEKPFEALMQKQSSEPSNPARVDEVQQLQDMIARDRPSLVLAYEKGAFAYRSPWTGFTPGPLGWFLDKFTAQSIQKG
ncbi:MAG TPA: peptide ABC transporter substrate-binding protein [Conexibacter sp.]|nr:peptide ABC transporter substrate-binding protein [Conexibacter sp.]